MKNVIIPVVVAVGVLAGCLLLLDNYASHAYSPLQIKLADCTNDVYNIPLQVPRGHAFHISLRFAEKLSAPDGAIDCSYSFSGGMEIFDQTNLVTAFAVDSEKAWLTTGGYVLTGLGLQNTNAPQLDQFIRAGKEYNLRIKLEPPPPANASLWLYWHQSRSDQIAKR